jgi:hypothetical protein
MGTRADFYVGKGPSAEWIGSVSMDGYPDSFPEITTATNEVDFRLRVAKELTKNDCGTVPEQGWPWPWKDSRSTDYAYAYDGGRVQASRFGSSWFDPASEPEDPIPDKAMFPDMYTKANNAPMGSKRSGLMLVRFNGGDD